LNRLNKNGNQILENYKPTDDNRVLIEQKITKKNTTREIGLGMTKQNMLTNRVFPVWQGAKKNKRKQAANV